MKLFDSLFVLALAALLIIGLVVQYSAGYSETYSFQFFSWLPVVVKSSYFIKQLVNIGIASIMLVVVFLLGTERLEKLAIPLYLLTIALLLFVLFAGQTTKGSSRWIPIGPIRFQPSELAKISLIIFFSWYISRYKDFLRLASLKQLIVPGVLLLIPLLLVFKQPDLGTSLTIFGIIFAMFLLSGIKPKLLLYSAVGFLSFLPVAWFFLLKPYQKGRIMTLLNPESDPFGKGYHTIQSKIAIGSGGISGKGFLEGSQVQLEFLPEHTTDFVFSLLAEELGLIGCSILMISYLVLIIRTFSVCTSARNLFAVYLTFGLAIYLLIHFFVNVGMVIGILPVVGLPLPFVSYGGSVLMMVMILAGAVLRINFDSRRL